MNGKPLQNWPPEVQSQGWRGIVVQIAAVALVSGAIAYVATNPIARAVEATVGDAPAPVHARKTSVPPPAAQPVPVTITNPFDSTETFEFPSGTSETEARQSVAELLMQRAQERKHAWSKHTKAVPVQ